MIFVLQSIQNDIVRLRNCATKDISYLPIDELLKNIEAGQIQLQNAFLLNQYLESQENHQKSVSQLMLKIKELSNKIENEKNDESQRRLSF